MNDSAKYSVLAAQVAGAHGVSGNVKLRLIGADHETTVRSLVPPVTVSLVRTADNLARELTLLSLRKQSQPKGAWIARFKEITDRTAAEEIQGCDLLIEEGKRSPLPEGEYYVDQLIGLQVVTDTGKALGAITDVLNTPANDVYVTDQEALIPVVSEFVLTVDLSAGVITVRDVPGYLP